MPDINENVTMVGLAAVTATGAGADYTNPDALGALFFLEITAASGTTPTLDIKLQAKDPTSGRTARSSPARSVSSSRPAADSGSSMGT